MELCPQEMTGNYTYDTLTIWIPKWDPNDDNTNWHHFVDGEKFMGFHLDKELQATNEFQEMQYSFFQEINTLIDYPIPNSHF